MGRSVAVKSEGWMAVIPGESVTCIVGREGKADEEEEGFLLVQVVDNLVRTAETQV